MQRIHELLAGVDRLPDSQCKLSYKGGIATVTLPSGRFQTIEISRINGSYLLSSKVIGSTRAQALSPSELVEFLWRRNTQTGIVALTLDDVGRIVGRIYHDSTEVDLPELTYYLSALAEECDRLEFLLTGRDDQ